MLLYMPSINELIVSWISFEFDNTTGIRYDNYMPEVCEVEDTHAILLLVNVNTIKNADMCLLVKKRNSTVLVNGLSTLSANVLHHRDEVSFGPLPEHRFYYSSEVQKKVRPFHEGDVPVFCARSKTHITEGMPAVQCQCGLWYVQSIQVPAYTYGDTCVGCGVPTALDAGWTPQPVVKSCCFTMDEYRHDLLRRRQELCSGAPISQTE